MSDEEPEEFEIEDHALPEFTLWDRLVSPFDFIIEWTIGTAGRAVEGGEWLFHVCLDRLLFLLMPWRWFRTVDTPTDISAELVDDELPTKQSASEKVIVALLDHFYGLVFGIYEAFSAAAQVIARIASRIFPRQLFWPIYWIIDGLVDAYDFWMEWWYSRNFRRLLFAAPALVLGLVLLFAASIGFLMSNSGKITHYQRRLADAEKLQDDAHITLINRRLEQLGFENVDELAFRSAIEKAQAGNIEEAYSAIQPLAPLDQPGLLGAHLWMAGALLEGVGADELSNEEFDSQLSAHVRHALSLNPDAPLARRFNVELQLRRGDASDDVVAEMKELAKIQKDLHAPLSHELRVRGDLAGAKRAARTAIRNFEQRESKNALGPGDTGRLLPLGYLRMAECYQLLDDSQAERKLLAEGVNNFPDVSILQDVLRARTAAAFQVTDLTSERAQALAESVFQTDKSNREAMLRLVFGLVATIKDDTKHLANAGDTEVAARKIVDHLKQQGQLPTEVLVFAGDFHLLNERTQDAEAFYREACEYDPAASFAWNNLASIWSSDQPINLEAALEASDKAIALNPDPRFYDTRGQTFAKLQRWPEAISDLEMAISGSIPNAPDAHRSLVTAYKAIGQPEQASAHESMLAKYD